MKIDVEGMELEVILGNNWKLYRPWVLCIERNQDTSRRLAITTILHCHSYKDVFYDGINDYFIAQEQIAIWDEFSYAGDVILNGVPLYYIFAK